MARKQRPQLECRPLTRDRWDDFKRLFGARGACGGCWCMYWRQTRAEFERKKGAANRRAMLGLVNSGRVPGLLGYVDGEPAAWISVAPREEFGSLERSRILRPVDDEPVWSVVCLFIAKAFRHRGVAGSLLKAAVRYVESRGGRIVEGYAVEPKKGTTADVFAYPGPAAAYRRAGFREVARRSETRPIMRYVIRGRPGRAGTRGAGGRRP